MIGGTRVRDGQVTSKDGTAIRYLVDGSGPPVLVVPGTLAPLAMYRPLTQLLSATHTVVVLGRRGYGLTATGPGSVRFATQVEDVTAVLEEIREPVALCGHSLGGLIGLSAALAAPALVAKAVLYEPPVALLGRLLEPMLRRCRLAVEEGRPADAVRTALEVSGSPTAHRDDLTDTALDHLVPLVPGLLVDLECTIEMDVALAHWAGLTAPLTLMQGERTVGEYARSTALLRTIYPDAHHEIAAGQAHFPRDMGQIASAVAA